jgi:proline dehydrogenase
MFRSALLAVAGSARLRSLAENSPLTAPVVSRFVAGATEHDALPVVAELVSSGRLVTLDHLGEDTTEPAQAAATVRAYQRMLRLLGDNGLAARAEVSVKLSAVGQSLPTDGDKLALESARAICAAAADIGTTVTLDMEDYTTVDSTLGVLRDLRVDFPWAGAVLQAQLRRTEADCRELAGPGSRVRLCKGAYAAPASVAFASKAEGDRSYARCLAVLFAGRGYPMVATHDPRMIAVAGRLAAGRGADSYEYQMLYGVRADEQHRLTAAGRQIRIYVPYGADWYGYFARRLAERPANLRFFLRSLIGRRPPKPVR